jgi:hypothetical protein
LMDADDAVQFHPEWPTFKKATNLPFRRYKNVVFPDGKKAYMPIEDDSVLGRGTAGFIDFVFGNYESPHTALELSLKFGWAHEEIVDDFLKIIDSRNPFKVGFSFNVVIRNALVSRGLNNLELHIQDALEEAKHRLDGVWCGSEREIHLLVSEISETGRRHWHYRPEAGFVRGIW